MLTRRGFLGSAAVWSTLLSNALRTAPLLRADAPQPAVSAGARALHQDLFVFDAHVHALDREFYYGGSMDTRYADGQWDLPRAHQGGEGAIFLSLFIPEEYYPSRLETRQTLRRLDHAYRQLQLNSDRIELALTPNEVLRIRGSGKMAAVLDIEGSYDLDGDLGILREMYARGIRCTQLSAHNWDQNYADSCCQAPKWNGLTAHGREVIYEMNRLGMMINVSHSSDEAMAQAIEASEAPVIATHHGLRRVNNLSRTIPDRLLEQLVAKRGLIAFQIGSEFNYPRESAYISERHRLRPGDPTSIPDRVRGKTIYEVDALVAPQYPLRPEQVPDEVMMSVDDWVGVVDQAIRMVGEDFVAIGTDFDGGPTLARAMRDVRDLPMITDAMLRLGYSQERIRKFWGGNLLRFFGEAGSSRPAK